MALVDLDLQFGDVAVMLHVESHTTAIDALAQQGDQIDSEFIEEVMATGPEGVRALLAPASPEFADLVNTANLRAILRELAKGYDHIVVDTPSHLEERNLEAIEMADQIIVVTSFNFPAIKDTKVTLKLLQSLGVDREKICVVLNQTRAKVTFQRAEVEDSLRFRVLVVLPFEPRVDDCIDNGRQIVTAEPKAEFSKQFQVAGGSHRRQRGRPGGQGGRAAPASGQPPAFLGRARLSMARTVIRVLIADESARIIENVTRRSEPGGDLVVCAVAQDGDTGAPGSAAHPPGRGRGGCRAARHGRHPDDRDAGAVPARDGRDPALHGRRERGLPPSHAGRGARVPPEAVQRRRAGLGHPPRPCLPAAQGVAPGGLDR